MIASVLLLAAAQADGAAVPTFKALAPRAEADCAPGVSEEETVVVCGRRPNDRYRLPPVAYKPGALESIKADPNSLRPAGCGGVNSDRNCTNLTKVVGIPFGSHPPPIVIVDWSKIPDPPPQK